MANQQDTLNASTKAVLLNLIAQRKKIEEEISECSERLSARGTPASNLHTPLIDNEGFPRPDAGEIRADRHRIAVLSYDHKAMSAEIEQHLHMLHAIQGASPTLVLHQPSAPRQPEAQQQHQVSLLEGDNTIASRPFAVVDDVSPDSPASAAGVMPGDQLWRFGSVSGSNLVDGGTVLQAVAVELQTCKGQPTEVVFLRLGQPVKLIVTPQRWNGRGLLGCHLRLL